MSADQDMQALRLGAILDATTIPDLRAATMAALGSLGVSAAFFLAPLTGDPRIGRIVTNYGLPPIWERHYRAGLHLVDPLPRIALKTVGAFCWPNGIRRRRMSAKEKRYLTIAARNGLAKGIGVACYGPFGRCGFLGAAWPHEMPPADSVLMRFNNIGQLAFQHYCALIPLDSEVRSLSDRELQVLQWIARGKSNGVIADILEISASSVDVYVRRIFDKLNVSDRTTACIKAFSLGLIVSSDYEELVRGLPDRGI